MLRNPVAFPGTPGRKNVGGLDPVRFRSPELAEPIGQVRHPVHQIALLVRGEVTTVLAHETTPIRVPHHPVGDAGHRPVDRDLSRILRIAS